jgi:hypothetical protein
VILVRHPLLGVLTLLAFLTLKSLLTIIKKAIELILEREYPEWSSALARQALALAGILAPRRRERWLADLDYDQMQLKEPSLLCALSCLVTSPWLGLRDRLGAARRARSTRDDKDLGLLGETTTVVPSNDRSGMVDVFCSTCGVNRSGDLTLTNTTRTLCQVCSHTGLTFKRDLSDSLGMTL